jgi:hypothetical protein
MVSTREKGAVAGVSHTDFGDSVVILLQCLLSGYYPPWQAPGRKALYLSAVGHFAAL